MKDRGHKLVFSIRNYAIHQSFAILQSHKSGCTKKHQPSRKACRMWQISTNILQLHRFPMASNLPLAVGRYHLMQFYKFTKISKNITKISHHEAEIRILLVSQVHLGNWLWITHHIIRLHISRTYKSYL